MMDKNVVPKKLIWVDLEMTGLNPATDRILEVAVVITDFEFKELATYEAIIKQPDAVLANMNEWATRQHAISGLTQKVHNGRDETEVVGEIAQLIREQFGDEPAILAGNSIHQDRAFIRQWWPDVDALLHYRMLDVSSLKILMQGKYGQFYEKPEVHRAKDDIEASIAELEHYLKLLSN